MGLVFAPSPRRLTPGEARDLLQKAEEAVQRTKRCACGSGEAAAGLVPSNTLSVLRPGAVDATLGPLTVGVFVDADADVVASLATYLGLAAVQLHGEGGATPAAVRRALTAAGAENGTLVIKAVGVEPGETDVPGLLSGCNRLPRTPTSCLSTLVCRACTAARAGLSRGRWWVRPPPACVFFWPAASILKTRPRLWPRLERGASTSPVVWRKPQGSKTPSP